MSRVLISSDWHIDHQAIPKYRTCFGTVEENNQTILENAKTILGKRDTMILLGDVSFSIAWLLEISKIRCGHKILILGNHDIQGEVKLEHLMRTFDKIYSLTSKNNCWLTHAPIHPDEIRTRIGVIHGHTHYSCINDPRYVNVCVDVNDFKPLFLTDVVEKLKTQINQGHI